MEKEEDHLNTLKKKVNVFIIIKKKKGRGNGKMRRRRSGERKRGTVLKQDALRST